MPLTVWRIVPESQANTAFDGEGARLFGGRWNSPGTRMVYTAESRALAALETLVHLTPQTLGRRLLLIGLEIDESWVESVDVNDLPPDWQAPIIPQSTRKPGDEWIAAGRSPVMRVPSVIIPEEFNYLLNPAHSVFSSWRIVDKTPFCFDPRLAEAKGLAPYPPQCQIGGLASQPTYP